MPRPKCKWNDQRTKYCSFAQLEHVLDIFSTQMDISLSESDSSDSMVSATTSTNNSSPYTVAFVKVDFVSPGSPAEESGICKDDEIVEFGSINASNFTDLKQIGELVMHRQNQQIVLKVKRRGQLHELKLIPKTWSGRGLLGCSIVLAK